ncbi:GNAT family N-acetyltransferase [Asticcacaulis sp. BYS171W]|uniref:GNAT family N-acetyltransferase n=1 Tax=Asticcacaulis aquaticus TaxID=2984212 RepID=A0ABT5HVZ8_9CAUL|nr:GNAT family N-acetyltransferase [Asticcacaulis aquaticus]MDC7684240.1 GNAT family N-acetyltransferase [Asticcacaulis aquaticus]
MNATSLKIRSAGRSDLTSLIDLYQHLSEGDEKPLLTVAEEIFEKFLTYQGSEIIVGEVAGQLVASCTLVVVPNLTRGGRPYGLLENVVTHRDFRNHGFGRQLLHYASDIALKADCYKVMLMTGSKKPETIQFYLGAGFEQSKIGFQMRRIPPRPDT